VEDFDVGKAFLRRESIGTILELKQLVEIQGT
jgi:hypothetical protein